MRLASVIVLVGACAAEPATGVETAEVLGGSNAPAGKWPDAAAVLIGNQQACTGVLIAPTIALTAGHCFDPGLNAILVGTTSLARPSEGETLQVTKRVEYPSSQTTEDLTLLVLAKASKFAPRPIATGWARFDIVNGAKVALVGYGAIDREAQQYINDLQEAETTISDAECTSQPDCNPSVKPGGELAAGAMGIDTCAGDSGGPLYLMTDYGAFLAGITSRGFESSQFPCGDGGIYGRPDKVIEWIEREAGGPVARGPEPVAAPIEVLRGEGGETTIAVNDPKSTTHTFAIGTPPAHGTAKVREDGRVRVCTDPGVAGDDAVTVTVTDATNAARTLSVRIPVRIEDGEAAGEACSVEAFEEDGEGGGCCDSGRGAGGSVPLALGVLVVLRRRRRVR